MDRSTIYTQEQGRSFDILWAQKDVMVALGALQVGVLGTSQTVVDGLIATPTSPASLVINVAAGHVYQQSAADGTAWGSLTSDSTLIQQQGYAAAQPVTLATTGLSAGQNRWALVQAQFAQVDAVRTGDPTGGLLYYWNSAAPDFPLEGPGGSATVQDTVRQGVCSITVVYGLAAATGSEVPPSPSSGSVPLYLVDLTYGQTAITSGQILVAGPSVGVNVPNNYPGAPFVAGLLNSHHSGGAGQAPKIQLTSEVQGILPLANLPASSARGGGGLSTSYAYAGNPNGHVAGTTGSAGVSPPDLCYDPTDLTIWICTTSGTATTAVWKEMLTLGSAAVQAVSAPTNIVLFSTTTSFTVPTGVSVIKRIRCWGGGGAGGTAAATQATGNGGGSAGYSEQSNVAVTPGGTMTITVGAGGAATALNGNAGGTTSITNTSATIVCSANGGGGGPGSNISAPATTLGVAATAGTGQFTLPGNPGCGSTTGFTTSPASGPGGCAPFTAGQSPGNQGGAGNPGIVPGGGGNGGGGSSVSGYSGGAGGHGLAVIEY